MHVRACALLSPLFMPALFGPKVDNRKISHLYIFSAFVGAEVCVSFFFTILVYVLPNSFFIGIVWQLCDIAGSCFARVLDSFGPS